MKPKIIEASSDLMTANQWTFEIPGSDLQAPNFNRVDGISRETDTITKTDGGTGLELTFHGGITRYSDLTIVRKRDNTENDDVMSRFVDAFQENGEKVNGSLVKYHNGEIVRKINFVGLSFKGEQFPGMDTESANAMEMTYPCPVDYWYEEKL